MNTELLDALEVLEKEKDISKETLLEAIENSLLTACKNHFGKADNVKVNIDSGDLPVFRIRRKDGSGKGRRRCDGDQPGKCQDDRPQV